MFNSRNGSLRIGVVAGELSGDMLGGGLIRALRVHYPDAQIEGIGGPQMLAAGMESHYPLELLSVMGLVEVLGRYRALKRCHDGLRRHFLQQRPDVFIGIDAPDFNLSLERALKVAGVPVVHYVSPTVWAWRAYRLPKIARACDLMLTLFPFEAAYYEKHRLPVRFVGHPLAAQIPLENDPRPSRAALGLEAAGCYVALLPGSRFSEVSRLSRPFLETARWLLARRPHLRFIVPLANPHMREAFMQVAKDFSELPLLLLDGQARTAMTAADVVLLASGTATLEAALLKRPMVVAYKLATLTYWLAKWLLTVPYVSQPNLLAGRELVPELIQAAATPAQLGAALLAWLDDPAAVQTFKVACTEIHQRLQADSDQLAATAILELLASRQALPLPVTAHSD